MNSKQEQAYRVIHKLPQGDSPYVRAKHAQLVEKDFDAAIRWFRIAIQFGDRIDSALKDMAVVMKQHDRAGEAIEAVKFMRHLCSKQAQESLDNVLIDLYKKCGRIEEHIQVLKKKLRIINQGEAFNGKPTKTARSHGKKFQVTLKQETARILQGNYSAAEVVYSKARLIEPDVNKTCNLCVCLMKQGRHSEAMLALDEVLTGKVPGLDDPKSRLRVEEINQELESVRMPRVDDVIGYGFDQVATLSSTPFRSRRLPIFEEILPLRDQMAC